MNDADLKWIAEAIEIVSSGVTNKIESPDKTIKVYSCGTIIRIDIKKGVNKK